MGAQPTEESIKELLSYLGSRLFHIHNYYHIYSELGLHYNTAVNKEAATAYLEIINKHKAFFMPVQECLRATLTVELCSFIVKKEKKYKSLGKAIDDLSTLPDAPNLNQKYNQLLIKNKNIISHIEKFRNQYYAHKTFADLLMLPSSSDKEFQELLADIKDLLGELNSYFGSAIVFLEDATIDTHNLMNNLVRGEMQRLDALQVEFISDMYKSGKSNWHK